jgi:ABC-type amino acid transport system permease subunit
MVIIMAVGLIATIPSCGLLVAPITAWMFTIGALHLSNNWLCKAKWG